MIIFSFLDSKSALIGSTVGSIVLLVVLLIAAIIVAVIFILFYNKIKTKNDTATKISDTATVP
jgi:uncharacterized membrane protein